MKLKSLIGIVFLLICGSSHSFAQQFSAILLDPLEKVLPETVFPFDTFKEIHVAKGEWASAQVLLRSAEDIKNVDISVIADGLSTKGIKSGAVGYVHADRHYTNAGIDRLVSSSGYYPDPIMEGQSTDLKAGVAQPYYLSIPIDQTTKAGIYKVKLRVTADGKSVEKDFDIYVHNVSLEPQKLWVTNWYSLSPERLKLMNDGNKVEPYSETYWKIIGVLAKKMAEYNQNVVLISALDLASYKVEKGIWKIDFKHFDQTVEIFKKAGVLGRIEGGHIGHRSGDWASSFVVRVPVPESDTVKFKNVAIQDPEAKEFYKVFFLALKEHLQKKGLSSIYFQHIADEPTGDNKQSYIDIATYVKSIVPDFRIMEACHSKDLAETIDLWVPQLDFLSKDFSFYKERLKKDDEVWFYTCLSPRDNYANRFLDQPLIKTRLLHWINYKYGIKGYLHWGLNYWNDDPYKETTGINSEGGNILPAGDSWIVYPGYLKLYGSIRLEAVRDGINDYTLLQMLENKNPSLAKEIIDNMVFRFDWYDTSISHFRKMKVKILNALEE
ncbi:Uncharacterised protein [Sphingobacterium spiritivorum]|uniref:Uncharacterized protein n=1 Tax=Sphingobacterium spiritivorum TaxID=258 RepID=A0A380BH29_SPHSI|nr:DUF4091 domain-containing protein [Sphingobacterium spiritivorum]SUJ01440.1 Uncharacterised protein [Sphingobacterium spiritivorum]